MTLTKGQAIDVLNMVEAHGIADDAKKMAINALDLISHLKDRPCEACEFKVDGNCQKWACVFDEAIYGKGAGLNG